MFAEITDKGADEVLFSGQDQLTGLVANAGSWSLGALALLIVLKGLAYAISLAGFRGVRPSPRCSSASPRASWPPSSRATRPRRPIAVGLGAAVVAVLRIPLSAVVLAVLLTSQTGVGASPLIIVGVVVAYITTSALSSRAPAPHPAERLNSASSWDTIGARRPSAAGAAMRRLRMTAPRHDPAPEVALAEWIALLDRSGALEPAAVSRSRSPTRSGRVAAPTSRR